jgi:PBP1b-binding outer membrane lipoprotein LpoB
MRTYSFIAVIAIALVLTSCSADGEDTNYAKPEQVQQFDSFDLNAREGDTTSAGDPVKPIKRD